MSLPVGTKAVALATVALFFAFFFITTVPAPYLTAFAQSVGSNLIIGGDHSIFSYNLDLCSAVHLGSCNVGVSGDESFTEAVEVTTEGNTQLLIPGNILTLSEEISPSSGTATFSVDFVLGVHTYPISWSSTLPGIGNITLHAFSIPLNAILLGLGIVPPIPVPGSFTISQVVESRIVGALSATGFNEVQGLTWDSAGVRSELMTLTGDQETSSVELTQLTNIQDWQISFDITGLPIVGPVHLYSASIYSQRFESGQATPLEFYHVTIDSSYGGTVSPLPGSAWYASGYQMVMTANPVSSYSIQSWSSGGQILCQTQQCTVGVEGPMRISANFAKVSAEGFNGQGVLDFFDSAYGYVLLIFTLIVIIAVGVWRYRASARG